jgi:hypothetical protein
MVHALPCSTSMAWVSPRGKRVEVKPNGLVEIVVARDFKVKAGSFGVVKVVCLTSGKEPFDNGIVGYQRQFYGETTFTETILQPVLIEILKADWDLIKKVCG